MAWADYIMLSYADKIQYKKLSYCILQQSKIAMTFDSSYFIYQHKHLKIQLQAVHSGSSLQLLQL